MEAWKPYEEVRNHSPDFRIRYSLYTEDEGGRKHPVYQGLRCDFSYDGDNIRETGIFAIHPEFENELGRWRTIALYRQQRGSRQPAASSTLTGSLTQQIASIFVIN
ncbi:hypothetical protein [Paenibacillus sp. PL91]|uniref:hypothetical protein n=1 Tax=Paenibacillus sp. PL91 TaxID=2729538 RepID=UPI001659F479|nr:hypothetical protein [Paenibacillus sp. PL91]MBC9204648.1 hypothetical protein [Paenibacillus sp. PL91]